MAKHFLALMFRSRFLTGSLIYCVAAILFLLLSQRELNYPTYISENALLVNHVLSQFSDMSSLEKYHADASRMYALKDMDKLRRWLSHELNNLNLEVYHQNFTFAHGVLYPISEISGSNMYAIMRSPSGGRAEALLLTVPLKINCHKSTCLSGSLSVVLSLLKMMRTQIYWAKDILVVFPEYEYIGLSAWINAYHGAARTQYLSWSELQGRSGNIQAGLNLELSGISSSSLDILPEGYNGLLSNLDLVNSLVAIANVHHTDAVVNSPDMPSYAGSYLTLNDRFADAIGLLKAVLSQASGSATGLHGLVINQQTSSVTLREPSLVDLYHDNMKKPNIKFVRIVESILRSLNNLQERLHQSFWYYLLPNNSRYISIGVYMLPILVAITGSLALQPLYQIFVIFLSGTLPPSSHRITESSEVVGEKDAAGGRESLGCRPDLNADESGDSVVRHRKSALVASSQEGVNSSTLADELKAKEKEEIVLLDFYLSPASLEYMTDGALWFVTSFLSGLAVHELPRLLLAILRHRPDLLLTNDHWSVGDVITSSLLVVTVFLIPALVPIVVGLLGWCFVGRLPANKFDWKNWTTSLLWGVLLACFATLNVSATFLISLFVVPAFLVVDKLMQGIGLSSGLCSRLRKMTACLLWLSVSPAALTAYAQIAKITGGLLTHSEATRSTVWSQASAWLMQSILEADLFGCWTWALATAGYTSMWTLTWINLVCYR